MTIIFMVCPGENCPIKDYCLRYRDKIENPNNAFAVPPYNHHRKSCHAFEENEPDVLRELNIISNIEEPRKPYSKN
jgi:hypothetical protein